MPVFRRSNSASAAASQVARKETLQNSHRWLAEHLAFYQAGKPTGVLTFLDTFAAQTHAWTVTNCCLVLSQKPGLTVPVTPRIIRSLNQANGWKLELNADAKPAGIFVPVTIEEPAAGSGPEASFKPGEKPNGGAGDPQPVEHVRVVFRLVPCVYDLRTDVVGGAEVELPEDKPDFRSKLFAAVMAKYGPQPEFFGEGHRVELAARQAIVSALSAKGPSLERRIPVSEHYRFAAERLGTYVLVRALGQPCAVPCEALNGMHDPKQMMAALGPGMRAVRAVLDPLIAELGLQTARQAALNYRSPAAQAVATEEAPVVDEQFTPEQSEEFEIEAEETQSAAVPIFDISASVEEEEEDEALALGLS